MKRNRTREKRRKRRRKTRRKKRKKRKKRRKRSKRIFLEYGSHNPFHKVTISSQLPINAGSTTVTHVNPYFKDSPQHNTTQISPESEFELRTP